jgi:HrpA-like RNA helicase
MNLITEKDYIDDTVFQHPFTCMLAGPTMSGKTTILTRAAMGTTLKRASEVIILQN